MRFVLIISILSVFSFSAFGQSEQAKEDFMLQLFDDYKHKRAEALKAYFIDSALLDDIITEIIETDEKNLINYNRDDLHKKRREAEMRFSKSVEQTLDKFNNESFKAKLLRSEPTTEVFIQRDGPIPSMGIRIKFYLTRSQVELNIDQIVYDKKRKRFAIVSDKMRTFLLLPSRREELRVSDGTPKGGVDWLLLNKNYNNVFKPSAKSEVVQFVEQLPEYPGGQDAMNRFIQQNIQYPSLAKDQKTQGTVYIQFTVSKSGEVQDAKIVKDIGGTCGVEALRIANMMPKWKAGKQGGKEVDVRYTLPINFKLQ